MSDRKLTYFLGANSNEGFVSVFNELYDPQDGWKAYIIKGGPGTGKSSFMKKVVAQAEKRGLSAEEYRCSSDPASLDAIVIPEIKVFMADGTSPHILEPKYPGAVETTVDMSVCWDASELKKNAKSIITVTDCNKALHKQSLKFVTAAKEAMLNNEKIILAAYSSDKVHHFATRFVARNIKETGEGKEKKRFLSALTPNGYVTFFDTATALCDEIYSISDDDYATAGLLINELRRCASAVKADVIVSPNPINPNGLPLDIIFPNEKIGFFTSTSCRNFKAIAKKNINAKRFLNQETALSYKQRLGFNSKAIAEFTDEAAKLIEKAKLVHDDMEKHYIKAMDFEKVNIITEKILAEIF